MLKLEKKKKERKQPFIEGGNQDQRS